MRHPRITITAVAVAAVAAVGGITVAATENGSNSSSHAGSPTSAASGVGGSATVQTATATVRGTKETILVDSHGLPLYTYNPDTVTTSRVTGRLAVLWPPVVATHPTESGLNGQVASVATTNGNQVAYNGHFLYTFVEDRPGKVTGQGVQSFFVATPKLGGGAASSPSTSSPQSTSPQSGGYGY